jgi:hypothetical protein
MVLGGATGGSAACHLTPLGERDQEGSQGAISRNRLPRERTPPLTLLISMANLLGLTGSTEAVTLFSAPLNNATGRQFACNIANVSTRTRDVTNRTVPKVGSRSSPCRRPRPRLPAHGGRLQPCKCGDSDRATITQGSSRADELRERRATEAPSWRRRPEPDTEVPRRPTPRPGGPPRCVFRS